MRPVDKSGERLKGHFIYRADPCPESSHEILYCVCGEKFKQSKKDKMEGVLRHSQRSVPCQRNDVKAVADEK